MSSKVIKVDSNETVAAIFGSCDANAEIIEKKFSVALHNRLAEDGSDSIIVSGDDDDRISLAAQAVRYLAKMARYSGDVTDQTVIYVCDTVISGKADELTDLGDDCICVTMKGKPIKAKTVGQKRYVNAIKKNTVVLGVGPAGTGKTFLAVAMAVRLLRKSRFPVSF